MQQLISKSYKGRYPFRIGTTSYIYPDNIIENIKRTGRYVDEVELLFFESKPSSLPSSNDIQQLYNLAEKYNLSYNIHLPTDIFLGDFDHNARFYAVNSLLHLFDLLSPLPYSTCTLHLECNRSLINKTDIKKWQDLTYKSMEKLVVSGIKSELISIETLMYPFEWAEKIITDFNFSVCLDIGHLILLKKNIKRIFNKYRHKTSIIHLHGVKRDRDHMPLDTLTEKQMISVVDILKNFNQTVSLEIFSLNYLIRSLSFLDRFWEKHVKGEPDL